MPEATKKPPIDDKIISLTIKVHQSNVTKIRDFVRTIETDDERTFTVAEVFPECIGKEREVALRAYRTREGVTQKQLSQMTHIPQRHISEMENRKRGIGKERARKIAEALNVSDYRIFL
jgi:hypothetical protein